MRDSAGRIDPAKPGTLFNTEAVLFIDDRKPQALEDDIVGEQGMSADQEFQLSSAQTFDDSASFLVPFLCISKPLR